MPSLSSAANFDDITQAEQCIANGDNVETSKFGYTPLLIAANHNALQVAALLIANGANVKLQTSRLHNTNAIASGNWVG